MGHRYVFSTHLRSISQNSLWALPTLPGLVQLGCHHPKPDHPRFFWKSRQPPLPLLSFLSFFQSLVSALHKAAPGGIF